MINLCFDYIKGEHALDPGLNLERWQHFVSDWFLVVWHFFKMCLGLDRLDYDLFGSFSF